MEGLRVVTIDHAIGPDELLIRWLRPKRKDHAFTGGYEYMIQILPDQSTLPFYDVVYKDSVSIITDLTGTYLKFPKETQNMIVETFTTLGMFQVLQLL